jgi:hypothetical protein
VTTVAPGTTPTAAMETVADDHEARLAGEVLLPSRSGDADEYAELVLSIVATTTATAKL